MLRAGLTLLESAATLLPSSQTFHVGYRRDEETLVATPYLNKLPASFTAQDRVLVTDPMLATGTPLGHGWAGCLHHHANP